MKISKAEHGVFFCMRTLFTGIFISFSLFSNAQLCTGSLGDPVVNITFGTASTPDTHFTPPVAYVYTGSTCPNDGYYTIATSTSGCFGNSWHTVNADHSGGGAFMLVNASYVPADFFVTTVTGLCPNTTYEFSAWIMNVLISPAGIQPNLTFHIETPAGIVLGTFNTGNISVSSQPKWEQYGFYFTTTAGNPDVVIRITNNAPGGIGNDLALDDITFRPCGPVLNSIIQTNGSDSIGTCVNEQQQYDFDAALSPGFLVPVFQWQLSIDSGKTWKDIAGANSLQYQRRPTVAGQYLYRLTVAESGNAGIAGCRIASNILTINVHPKPFVNAGPDRVVVVGDYTMLMGDASGENISYSWSPPDYLSSDTSLLPVCTPARDVYYMLTANSEFGCQNKDYVYVKAVADIFVPTAFTPDNDGKNDNWRIPYLDPFLEAEVNVYNRYGQLVYHVSGGPVNWDGTVNGILQPSGVYIYLIRFKESKKIRKGTFTLIR